MASSTFVAACRFEYKNRLHKMACLPLAFELELTQSEAEQGHLADEEFRNKSIEAWAEAMGFSDRHLR